SQLAKKGKILFENVKSSIPDITIEECIECVRYRVICETWNGIIIRERNTINTLKGVFPDLIFVKKDGVFDHHYAVDYEIMKDSELICGIQIKPKSYTFSTPYLNKARSANQKKNAEYSEKFGKPVFDVISKGSGEVQNPGVLLNIKALIK
ncbi:MAG: MjaI family restriction endonuclease, partial [Bacteroidales bacterium]